MEAKTVNRVLDAIGIDNDLKKSIDEIVISGSVEDQPTLIAAVAAKLLGTDIQFISKHLNLKAIPVFVRPKVRSLMNKAQLQSQSEETREKIDRLPVLVTPDDLEELANDLVNTVDEKESNG